MTNTEVGYLEWHACTGKYGGEKETDEENGSRYR